MFSRRPLAKAETKPRGKLRQWSKHVLRYTICRNETACREREKVPTVFSPASLCRAPQLQNKPQWWPMRLRVKQLRTAYQTNVFGRLQQDAAVKGVVSIGFAVIGCSGAKVQVEAHEPAQAC
ncbi:hypothetical protein HPB50_022199 [Hyalomma asiaticum]|uniref:Uncharacterized protein n=1 Tax=Hyalomma asiaticum TaxID=266040 RepID=A0ACB7TBV6_HYAAI|nr:hypothetical protein HPB50_022199 [Hyalomma asiaticum]